MNKVFSVIQNFEELLIKTILPFTSLLITVSVFGRYTGLFNFYWAEELTRYLYIWIAFIGISLGVKGEGHYNVQIVVNSLPLSAQKIMQIVCDIIVVAFLGLLVYHSIILLNRLIFMKQTSPILRIPMFIPYLAVTIGCFSMCVRVFFQLTDKIKRFNRLPEEGVQK